VLKAGQIDLAAAEYSFVFRCEILANDSYQTDGRKVARGLG
jgi:hypothetical protein